MSAYSVSVDQLLVETADIHLKPQRVLPSPYALARVFAAELRNEIGDRVFAVVALNMDEKDPNICHSHDFCDANQVMIDAWEKVAGWPCSCDPNAEGEFAVWTKAWNLAKKNNFSQCVLLAFELYHAGHRIHKTGGLVDPSKRLLLKEIHDSLIPPLPLMLVAQAIHMVHFWCIYPDKLGIPDRL